METLCILLILLLATRALGELAVRLGQPALVGELLAGIGLGTVATQYPEAPARKHAIKRRYANSLNTGSQCHAYFLN